MSQRLLSTGVPGLDRLLGGGLLSASLYLLEGRAGAGKTILASQIAFHRAAMNDKVVYVTLVAEAHGKLLNHLRQLSFFDEAAIGRSIVLLSGSRPLLTSGLDGLMSFLVDVVRDHQPSFMVLDGFRAALTAIERDASLASFMHQLDLLLAGIGCTTMVLSPMAGSEARPEHTLVDGLVEVGVAAQGLRRARLIEVRKLRGANHLTGQHVFEITEAGIRVFPRLEGLGGAIWSAPPESPGRLSFGVPTLDRLTKGGVMPGSTTAVLGAPGAGKTLLGLAFLYAGAQQGEQVEYFGFYESPERLLGKAKSVGLHLDEALRTGRFVLHWQPPVELLADGIVQRLLESLERTGARRLFLDGIDVFRSAAAFPERIPLLLSALTTRLRALGVTALFSEELPFFGSTLSSDISPLVPITDNILVLRNVETGAVLRRLLAVVKMRENAYDPTVRDFLISDAGITVGDQFDGPLPERAGGEPFTGRPPTAREPGSAPLHDPQAGGTSEDDPRG